VSNGYKSALAEFEAAVREDERMFGHITGHRNERVERARKALVTKLQYRRLSRGD
jgi:hypothetical protein